ncbi:DNA gyrase inhibitor YacG [Haemophilus haemoglobinophilus]|nr:DNA gyrase inhibitor YacG [Canicola haemoglobinophilus]
MTNETFTVACPNCQEEVIWSVENQFRPFCSKRCQLIDLGEWAAEEKAIPGQETGFLINDEFNKYEE